MRQSLEITPSDIDTARERVAQEALAHTGILDLSNLRLAVLPEELSGLQHLEILDCSRMQVSDLSPLAGLVSLQELNCWDTQVSDLSPLAGLVSLQELNCWNTQVSDLSPLAGLASLQALNCRSTQVGDLSPLASLVSLQELDCRSTQVSDLSPLAGLVSLQELDCQHTRASDLSPLAGLASLQKLDCSITQVSDLSPLAGLASLQALNCWNTQVSDLSPLAGLASLQALNCRSTQVGDLSPLAGLASLQKLNCWGTQVSDLSPLAGLVSLQELDCQHTRASDLSPLAGLASLQELDCQHTQVGDLSPLAGLVSLQALNCRSTQVGDLSPLAGLVSLQELDCQNTQVSDLSPLTELISLQRLGLNDCFLRTIPEGFWHAPALETLYLHKTRIPGIPTEVLSQYSADDCLDSLRAYLRALEDGFVQNTDAKLLILGNGRIGKTQICRRLRKEEYDPNVMSTHGILVSSASLPQPEDGSSMRLHLWDFGGQDIYHGTHALFMRTRAIFMLVWITESEEAQEYTHEGLIFRNHSLDYWLSYVRHLGGLDNPILVMQTRCDRPEDETRHPPIPAHALEGFRFCKLLQYSSLRNRGRAALDEALREAAAWLREEQGSILIGKGWMQVKLRLEALRDADTMLPPAQRRHRTLSQQTFLELCAEGEGDVDSPEYLLQYLHNCGIVFYRKGLFQERIILDQGWALEAIYTVFHREKCYRHLRHLRGRFYRSLLNDLVWEIYPEEEQELFLGMMLSCGICFIHQEGDEARGTERIYIAPDLLPERAEVEAELAERWDATLPTEEAVFEYELYQPGLVRSFVSAIGSEAGPHALYWKGGMLLYEHTCRSRALIQQQEIHGGWKGTIRLQTQNGDAKRLLAQLTRRLMAEQAQWGVHHLESASTPPPRMVVDMPSRESVAPELKFTSEPGSMTGYYVSYAWGDESEEGRAREEIVDRLCAEAEERGIRILRDKRDTRVGDSLRAFMQGIGRGKRIFIILSQKYLRSSHCVFELWETWRNSRLEPEEFLSRARIYALPDARIFGMDERIEHVRYWKEKCDEYARDVHLLDGALLAQYALIKEYVGHLGAILSTIADTILPCTFDELVAHGLMDLSHPPHQA